MAVSSMSKTLCWKFRFTLRFSNFIQSKGGSSSNEHHKIKPQSNTFNLTPLCTLWAGPNFINAKQQQSASSKDRKPRHPANVFIMYLQKVQEQIQKDHPDAPRKDIVAIASQQWKNLDPEEKSNLSMQRKELFEKYKEDMKNYINCMTPEEMKLEEKERQQRMARKLKMARREMGMPKMPASAFCCFMAEQYPQHAEEDLAVTQVFKKLRHHWEKLGEKDKEKYKQQSVRRSETYKEEMDRWEKEMMELGRFDVIRKSTLLRLAMGKNKKKNKNENEDL